LKSVEKPDSGILSSSIPFFGTRGSALQEIAKNRWEEEREKKIDLKSFLDYSRSNLLNFG
jgi:hypothetical protein